MKVTKKQIRAYIKHQLGTNQTWAFAALLKILENQTEDEQNSENTIEYNNIGFTGADGHIMTSIAKQYKRYKRLSPKQQAIVMKKMPKYWKQILNISDEEQVKNQAATFIAA
jgi:hypothetical protein